jgi:hypothetical protein
MVLLHRGARRALRPLRALLTQSDSVLSRWGPSYAIERETVDPCRDERRDLRRRNGRGHAAGRDVTHSCARDTSWALVDGGRRVLHARAQATGRIAGDGAPDTAPSALQGGLRSVPGIAHVLRLRTGLRRSPFDAVLAASVEEPCVRWPAVWSRAALGESVFVSVRGWIGGPTTSARPGQRRWSRPSTSIVAASGAAAGGGSARFAWSRDGGNTWAWTTSGLHAAYLQSTPPRVTPSSSARAAVRRGLRCLPCIAPGTAFERRGRLLAPCDHRAVPLGGCGPTARRGDRTADVFTSTDAGASVAHVATGFCRSQPRRRHRENCYADHLGLVDSGRCPRSVRVPARGREEDSGRCSHPAAAGAVARWRFSVWASCP